MQDWLEVQFGLSASRFSDLIDQTTRRLADVVRDPGTHPPDKVEMARGALRILVKGPHFIPRTKLAAYVDDLVHLLVAREALFPGEVRRSVFDGLVVGIPNPPRPQVTELSTHISEGCPDLSDKELLELVEEELERLSERHPRRLAMHRRLASSAVALVVLGGAWLLTLGLVKAGYLNREQSKIIAGLAAFFILAGNILVSIVLLRPKPSTFGPNLVDLSKEGVGPLVFMINQITKVMTEIYLIRPLLGLGTALGAYGFSLWVYFRGQGFAEAAIQWLKETLYAGWRALH